MTEIIKVLNSETHWRCGDGCCDNYNVISSFMYKDNIYQYDSGSIDTNIELFLKEVIGIEFEHDSEFRSLDD